MKTLGICLAFLLGPPGAGALPSQPADPIPRVSLTITAHNPPPIGPRLQLPSAEDVRTKDAPAESKGSLDAAALTLRLGLTGFLVLLSVYFYGISIELGREALRRDRLARRFVERNRTLGPLLPIQGCHVDQIDSLLLEDHVLEAS